MLEDQEVAEATGERYSWLFEDSPVAKYICAMDGTVQEANASLCRLLGLPRAEIVGRTISSFSLDPPLPSAVLGPLLGGVTRTYTSTRRYRTGDGRALQARVTLGVVRGAQGQPVSIFGELEDLTAQYLADHELDRQRHRLEMAIEASGISVWELDVVSGRMTVQEGARGEADFREQSMTYGDFVRTFHPDDRGALPSIRALRTHGGQLDLELRVGRAFGPVRWVHLKGRAVTADEGRVVRVVGTTADVTEPRAQRGELAAQRDRLDLALETAGMMAWEVHLGPHPTFSAIHADLMGLEVDGSVPVSGLTGCPVFGGRVYPDDRELVSLALRQGLNPSDDDLDVEYRWHDDHGALRWAHTRARAEHDPSGQVLRVTGTTVDVSSARQEMAARLRAERILSRALEASQDAYIGTDQRGLVTHWNPAAEAMFGWFREEVMGQPLAGRICAIDDPALTSLFADVPEPGPLTAGPFKVDSLRAGPPIAALRAAGPGESLPGVGLAGDGLADEGPSDRRGAPRPGSAGASDRRSGPGGDGAPSSDGPSSSDGPWSSDGPSSSDGPWSSDGPSGAEEGRGGAVTGRGPMLMDGAAHETEDMGLRREVDVHTRDGRHFPAEISAVRVEDDGLPFFQLFVRDLSERKAYESQLIRNALFDPVTGLPNRALLVDRLSGAVRRLTRVPGLLAVLFIDVDRFKHVNDSLGHSAGDEFLVELAGRIRGVLRPSDTIARFGADEFVVLCEALEGEREAMALALRVEGVFAIPFALGGLTGREVYASASIGIALASDKSTDAESLVRDAGTAMHRAKEHGGGHAEVFDAEIRHRSLAHLETESELRRALERSELSVYYQPVVDLTGRLSKVEALVRWDHPSGRVAMPNEFVPIAEETGLIVALGEVVLDMACRQVNAWRHDHPGLSHLGVAVNISSAQLRSKDAVERMASIVDRTGLPADALILEITESVFMDEKTGAAQKLAALRSLGVRLAVDDFGTGYSSLLYLRRYPLDMLKIDRSFVAGLVDNPEDATIVDAVVRLGHSFGLQTVAEGVETAEQLRLLRSLGCDLGQGHYWARPLPPETLITRILADDSMGTIGAGPIDLN